MNIAYTLYARRRITLFNIHPLYLYTLAFMLGIWMQAQEYTFPSIILFLVVNGLRWLYTRSFKNTTLLICILFFAAGAYRFYTSIAAYTTIFVKSKEHPLWCTGTVYDISPHNHPYFKQKISIALNALGPENRARTKPKIADSCTSQLAHCPKRSYAAAHAERCNALIHLFVPEYDTYAIDDVVTLHNLYLHHPKTKEDLIERVKDGIIALHFKTKKSRIQKTSVVDSRKKDLFSFKMNLLIDAMHNMNQAAKMLYATLFLGNKKMLPLPASTAQQFNIWGISHHLARSGLHLVIVIWLWSLCIQRIPCSTSIKHGALIALVLLYYIFSWPTLSFNRACFAFLLFHLCSWNKLGLDAPQTVAWTTLFFLFICPAHLFSLDFQLSFGLTHALVLFNHSQTKLMPHSR